jgi:hypothetical protein
MAAQRIDIGPQYPPAAGAARLAPLLSRKQLGALLADPLADPATLDAESVRSLLVATQALSIDLPYTWIDAALNGQWFMLPPESRHMRALWVSRIAPFVSSRDVWEHADLFDDLEPVWHEHIEKLLGASLTADPWSDVFRAHPACEEFAKVSRPHETTASAPADIRSRWQAQPAMAAPERGVDMEDTGAFPPLPEDRHGATRGGPGDRGRSPPADDTAEPPPPLDEDADAPPAPPMEPRRLQADVLLEDSMQDVTAFVANKTHVIDVSIGRGKRIRAAADIEDGVQEEFAKTDKDWIVLPVWFHAPGHVDSGVLRVPRDQTRNSTSQSFSFTAPADGRVMARVHIMRPGGRKLLQSAILAGDVVASESEAEAHEPDIELNVDVVAGNLHDPTSAEDGQAVITDGTTAAVEQDGSFVEIDVSQLQELLVKLVHKIETAADRHGLDAKAVGKTLVTLARSGQQLRTRFETQLDKLASADDSPLQIASLQSGDILPLELIYDGPPLSINSEICPTWQKAVREGNCNNCAGGGPDNDDAPARVCPMHFWSMRKVIERRSADTEKGRFHVSAESSFGRPSLRPIEAAVIAASGRVAASDVSDLCNHAVATLKVPAETAANWAEWVAVIHDHHPELLIAMPHNQAIDGGLNSALMMGEPLDESAPVPEDAALLAGSVTEAYVQLSGDRPGPIVLLLGCNTQFQEGRLTGFAGEFRKNGAALTVGTLGELRADQAPQAARMLLDQIVQPPKNAKSVGEVLLSTRRRLLGDGMIMALLLVANGDAEWLLPKEGAPDDEDA